MRCRTLLYMKTLRFPAYILVSLLLSGCAELARGGGGYGGYGDYRRDPYYDRPSYGNRYDRYDDDRRRRDRWEIEQERRRLEEERRRLDEQYRRPPPPPPPPPAERCPPGFRPSEQKCSREERRSGCQDIRMPGGLGCVKR